MKKLERMNEFDGLVHNADGSREFVDGSSVAGVNNWTSKNT